MMLGLPLTEGNVLQIVDAIFVNDPNTEGRQIQDEALLELLQTLLKKLHRLLP